MEAEPVQGKSFGDIESKLETIEEVENEDNSHNEKSVKAEQLINALSEMNPDDFNFRVSMTICVRCQLATTIQLDVDEEMSKEWTTRTEDEWMFLYFQSYLDDFDWKIAKCATETEYEETPYLLSPDVK